MCSNLFYKSKVILKFCKKKEMCFVIVRKVEYFEDVYTRYVEDSVCSNES